ncbi:conserved hypothetical protein, secreted [Candidatus Magnetomorum sp. HK-1]|nr:conserved hypothetical protein, secreted [Candidatus Magnetomorum sp. HK-1]
MHKIYKQLIITLILINSHLALAEINTLVNFQGLITDNENVAVHEGTYTLTFSLWDGEHTNTNKLWEESHTLFISRGIYSAMLGSIQPFPYSVTFAQDYYLGVQVNNEPDYLTQGGKLMPLVSTWTAFRAKTSGGKIIRSINENYTVTTSDDFLLISGDTIIALPQSSSVTGRIFTLKKMDTNSLLAIVPSSNDTIDNSTQPISLTEQYDEIELISTGQTWLTIGFPATAIRKLEAFLATKSNISDVYTRTYIDNTINAAITDITNTLQQKASYDDFYDKSFVDNALSTKLNTQTYNTGIALKANTSEVYTQNTINTLLSQKVDASLYTSTISQKLDYSDGYTRTFLDQIFESKANAQEYSAILIQKAFISDIYTRTYLDDMFLSKVDASQYSSSILQKANNADIYTRQYIDDALTGIAVGGDLTASKEYMDSTLNFKANVSDIYTRNTLDTLFNIKADTTNTYTRTYLDQEIIKKANISDTYTRTFIDQTFAQIIDVYTRTYLDEKLSALNWNEITSDSYTVTANQNYIVNNENTSVLSMPDSNELNVGDQISISSIGSGGWQIAQQSGQNILLGNKVIYRTAEPGEIWRERSLAGSNDWSCLKMSSDGRYIVAGVSFGNIYLSENFGETWTTHTFNPTKDWVGLSISNDGQKISASPTLSYIVSTTDGGTTWLTRTSGGEKMWRDIAGSSDGSKLIACVGGTSGDRYLYTSENSGETWTEQMDAGSNNWVAVAASTGFTKVAACVGGTSGDRYIYTSSDGGYVWKERTNSDSRNWKDIAMSSEGSSMAAIVYGGYIYTSTDSGLNWTEHTSAGNRYWLSVAMSDDGNTILASYDGGIYQSSDLGTTWTQLTVDSLNFKSIDMSSEATVFATGVGGGSGNRYILTSISENTAMTKIDASSTDSLSGKQYESATLQYIGNDTFTLLESDNTSSLNFQNGNVGIGTKEPARTLHVKDILRLEPRISVPDLPSAGDMYFDATTNKLKVYDGSDWQACW